jgi:quercetin dioxygenase-like cupin family protein
MALIAADAQRRHELPGASFHTLASPALGASETSVWRLRLEPHTPAVPHRVTREEIFVALSGSATARLDGDRAAVEPGLALVVPPGVDFELATGDEPFEALVCLPVGGQGVIGDEPPFTPPWAE